MFTIKKFCIYQQKNPARLRLKQMSRIKRGGISSYYPFSDKKPSKIKGFQKICD